MRLILSFLLLVLFTSLGFAPSLNPASAWQAKVDPSLLEQASQDSVEFLLFLGEQADLSAAAQLPTKAQKGAYVYSRLNETARRTQPPLLNELNRLSLAHRSYWIANMIWVRGDLSALQALARRPDVAHIYSNPPISLDLPPGLSAKNAELRLPQGKGEVLPEWNISQINTPLLWNLGYTGHGAVIAGQDTGYQWDHPALKSHYRGWDGVTANHDYNWHDAIHTSLSSCGADSPVPCDDQSHGTHTMGIMVGDDSAGNQIGVAPGARWIGCRNMDQGVGTPATYSECFQWFLAPTTIHGSSPRPDLAPDVISNSWTCPPSEGCNPDSLQLVVANTRLAGILVVAAAGNDGFSGCTTVSSPPATYSETYTVGATDVNDKIASFSSRGPSSLTGSIKPDVSAPGVTVRSSVPYNIYGHMSGTSMAAPHVAGLVALLISVDPTLRGQVDKLEAFISAGALHLAQMNDACGSIGQVPNNYYGWGRIDAWTSYQILTHPRLYFMWISVP